MTNVDIFIDELGKLPHDNGSNLTWFAEADYDKRVVQIVMKDRTRKPVKTKARFCSFDDIYAMYDPRYGAALAIENMYYDFGEHIIDKETIKQFIKAGADIIMIPAPGTIPGITVEIAHEWISYIHSFNKLAMTAIGTSQEGADTDTIRQIALNSKMAGADIHHIGDSGYVGMALPENILAYSIAIRGVRHTYHKIGQSINR